MAPAKRSRSASKRKPRKSSTASKKRSTGVSKSYTVLKKSTIDPKKKVSSQGKSCVTTKSGAYLAARIALKKTKRPSRIYLYRKKRIMTYSIKYSKKDGKTKASAKLVRTKVVKRKKPATKKKTTKRKTNKRKRKRRKTTTTTSRAAEIAKLKRKVARLSGARRRTV